MTGTSRQAARRGTIRRADEGRSIHVWGDRYTWRVTAEETGGAFALLEIRVQPGSGTPPHIHHAEDETFHVLEGTFAFRCGEEEVERGAGTTVHVPKGVVHAFRNVGAEPGRFLVLLTPAGFEGLFEALGTPVVPGVAAPPMTDADLARAIELAPRFHMEILPPA